MHGTLSLYNATIHMHKSSSIHAYQDFALNGANLYCETGQTCTIYCYSYGCANISSANGNGIYSVDCRYNIISNILCNTSNHDAINALAIDFDHDLSLPCQLIETLINFNIEDDLNNDNCNEIYLLYKNLLDSDINVLGINCDFRDCNFQTINYINQTICCTGSDGCYMMGMDYSQSIQQ